jgi:hypothetical protein
LDAYSQAMRTRAHTFAIDTWPDVDRAFPTFAKFI